MTATGNRAKEIFVQLVANCPPDEWASRLQSACAGDEPVRRRVNALLQAHRDEDSFLLQPADPGVATIEQPMAERIGTQIGPYKLLEQIGEGGMGLVYMAEQQRPVRRLVALKLVKPGMDSKQVIARFEAERQALAMMDHQNIAKVLDAGTTEVGRPYFVMELVRGIPINQLCDEKRLAVRQRLELFIQVCQAVQHAHQKGIIHRDLKPTNVLVTMNDATPLPKVIDFGIAKALGAQLTDHTLHTGYSQLVGTPLYMSPEQAEMNQLGVDTRSDVYSLGVMLYELLTGSTPFDKETLTKAGFDEMRRIIREHEPQRPSARLSTLEAQALSTVSERRSTDPRRITTVLRGELDWIVMKALEKDRSQRYESASAFAADIQRYLSGDLVQACPPSTFYRFRKFARKHHAVFTTTAIVAASLLIGTTVSAWQAIRATAAEAQATANEAKAKGEEQKATALAQSEATQRQRAEASEQQAKDRLVEVEQQRKQAEKNFEAALDAVDRMLANINDDSLNDVPRVGPLRRKMLGDAVAFLDRISIQTVTSKAIKKRVARTWEYIAAMGHSLSERSLVHKASQAAIAIAAELAKEEPNDFRYRFDLAEIEISAGWQHMWHLNENDVAAEHFRRAAALAAEMSIREPSNPLWLYKEHIALGGLSTSLLRLSKHEEALESLARSTELLDRFPMATALDRGNNLAQQARLRATSSPKEADELFRRAINQFRDYQKSHPTNDQRPAIGYLLRDAAKNLASRDPAAADTFCRESITLWREIAKERSWDLTGSHLTGMNRSLRFHAWLLRKQIARGLGSEPPDQLARWAAEVEATYEEALDWQRKDVRQFGSADSRASLGWTLNDYCIFLLKEFPEIRNTAAATAVEARKLKADALLTEAIQLCRALAAEFPDHKALLAELLKLQAQHFGQEKQRPESTDK